MQFSPGACSGLRAGETSGSRGAMARMGEGRNSQHGAGGFGFGTWGDGGYLSLPQRQARFRKDRAGVHDFRPC